MRATGARPVAMMERHRDGIGAEQAGAGVGEGETDEQRRLVRTAG